MREFHQMTYLLNIRTLSMRLDSSDWRVISRVMLSLLAESLQNKFVGPTPTPGPQLSQKLRQNLGSLTPEE